MPATEKDLAEDAPWKKIQQNTFTRWCNEHLKCVSKRIANLQTDLSDGLRLIALLEVLSQKKMHRKHNQRPTFRQMQLENVSVALEFLDRESIKLVSIGEGACNQPRGAGRARARAGAPHVFPPPLARPLPAIRPESQRFLGVGGSRATQLRTGLENKGALAGRPGFFADRYVRPRPLRPGWPSPRLSSHPLQAAPPPLRLLWERAWRVGIGQALALRPAPHPCAGGGPLQQFGEGLLAFRRP